MISIYMDQLIIFNSHHGKIYAYLKIVTIFKTVSSQDEKWSIKILNLYMFIWEKCMNQKIFLFKELFDYYFWIKRLYFCSLIKSGYIKYEKYFHSWPGADTGIRTGGCEIWKGKIIHKRKKRRLSYKNYLFKIRSDSNVFNGFFLILYWLSQKKWGKLGFFICSGGCGRLPPPPCIRVPNHRNL